MTLFLTQFLVYSKTFSTDIPRSYSLSYAESEASEKLEYPDLIVYQEEFDDEEVGSIPENWIITWPGNGSFTVSNETRYSGSKSAMLIDNSTSGAPCPYVNFPPQNGTIVVSFAVKPVANRGNNTHLIIYVDNGNFSGSNICFTEQGIIQFKDDYGTHALRYYSNDEWYKIKMIMNIPNNTYEIFINDILEEKNAKFTKFGTCQEIHRIIFGEAIFWRPIGYIDSILVRKDIRVPEDYPTVQEAVNKANPGNLIFVSSGTYYENICFNNKSNIVLMGENKLKTIINGRFLIGKSIISINKSSHNITICGLTIKNGNVGIEILGNSNSIKDNIISYNEIGIICYSVKNNLIGNVFFCNFRNALDASSHGNFWNKNYWDDYDGMDEDADGIGDEPYPVPFKSVDEHPLFLIQKVAQSPKEPNYDEKVRVYVKLVDGVEIDAIILNWTCDTKWKAINMTHVRSGKWSCWWSGKIPPQPYWIKFPVRQSVVKFKIQAKSRCGLWVRSVTYSYSINDSSTMEPKIKKPIRIPINVTENQPVIIRVNVTESVNASRVEKAILYWETDERKGSKTMEKESTIIVRGTEIVTFNGTIPGQPRNSNVTYWITAFDYAGNKKNSKKYKFKVGYTDLEIPEILILTIGEGEKKDFAFPIKNNGTSTIRWNISKVEGDWIVNVSPEEGLLKPGNVALVKVKIDATHLKVKSFYIGSIIEVTWNAVGSNVVNKSIIQVILTVTQLEIDQAVVSDDHCDVNSIQTIHFHVVWAHNYSAVQNCEVNVTCSDENTGNITSAIYTTNSTGWISFTSNSSMVGRRTWTVTSASYKGTSYNVKDKRIPRVIQCYDVTVCTQTVSNPTIIWDRIIIFDSGPANGTEVQVTQPVTIWFKAKYEYDGTPFDGTKGSLYINGTLMRWSSENSRWEIKYSSNTAETKTFKISDVVDTQHLLSTIEDKVGAITIIWAGPAPFWSQWAFFMMVAVIAALGGGIFSTVAFWAMKIRRTKH